MKKNKLLIVLISLLMIATFIYITRRNQHQKNLVEEKKKEYLDLSNYQDYYNLDISGIIIDKYISKKLYDKGTTYFILNNDCKFVIYNISNNYSYEPSDLIDFLTVNDSIRKPHNSRDFFIYRKNEKYYFRLGEDIRTIKQTKTTYYKKEPDKVLTDEEIEKLKNQN